MPRLITSSPLLESPRVAENQALRFGVFTFQAVPFDVLVDDVRYIEQLGLDAIWLADQAVPAGLSILEAWTALAGLAAATERIRLGTNVTNVAMRHPMMLARQALTVDQISRGRLEVGLGSGYYEPEQTAMGIDFLDGKGRVQRLIEVTEIMDRALRGEDVSHDGNLFHLREAISTPQPAQRPRPPIWLAAHATGSMKLAVRLADGTASFGDHGLTVEETLPAFKERMAKLDALCEEAGRNPGSLRRSYLSGFANEAVFNSRDSIADFVGRFAEAGATDFVFTFFNPTAKEMAPGHEAGRYADRRNLETLVNDVIPAYRADV